MFEVGGTVALISIVLLIKKIYRRETVLTQDSLQKQ